MISGASSFVFQTGPFVGTPGPSVLVWRLRAVAVRPVLLVGASTPVMVFRTLGLRLLVITTLGLPLVWTFALVFIWTKRSWSERLEANDRKSAGEPVFDPALAGRAGPFLGSGAALLGLRGRGDSTVRAPAGLLARAAQLALGRPLGLRGRSPHFIDFSLEGQVGSDDRRVHVHVVG